MKVGDKWVDEENGNEYEVVDIVKEGIVTKIKSEKIN